MSSNNPKDDFFKLNKSMTGNQVIKQVDSKNLINDDQPMNTPSREELNARLETIEARMDGRIERIEMSIDSKINEVKLEIGRTAAEIRSDMQKSQADLIKWVVGTAIALGAVSITVMTFVLNNATPKAPQQNAVPIIITIPSQSDPTQKTSSASQVPAEQVKK